jgi:hypothetical protein
LREEVTGGWKKMHDFYSLPNIITVIKWRRMRQVEHVTCMGRRDMLVGFLRGEDVNEVNYTEDRGIDGMIILKWIGRK